MTIQIRTTVVIRLGCKDEILECDQPMKAMHLHFFMIVDQNLVWPFKRKPLSSTFLWCSLLCATRWLTFESVVEILKCDHSNESCWAILSCGAVDYAVQGGSTFWVCGWNPEVWPFKRKLLSRTLLWHCLLECKRWFFGLQSLRIKSTYECMNVWMYECNNMWLLPSICCNDV